MRTLGLSVVAKPGAFLFVPGREAQGDVEDNLLAGSSPGRAINLLCDIIKGRSIERHVVAQREEQQGRDFSLGSVLTRLETH